MFAGCVSGAVCYSVWDRKRFGTRLAGAWLIVAGGFCFGFVGGGMCEVACGFGVARSVFVLYS